MKIYKQLRYSIAYIFFLWIILTAINIDKAYHIDDTFHLEASEYIGQHPLKPMSGFINWGNSPTPMYEHNQPPLFFYLICIYQKFFGNSEIALHLLLSIFTFLALLYFYKLTIFLNVKSPFLILTIFAFCPAFVVNQNLMTDIPILALSLCIMYYLLKGQSVGSLKYYLVSAIILTVGLLIKYSLLPLFFVILLTILSTRSYKKGIVLFIPLITLFLWSLWNFIEFGSVHIISRPKTEFNIKNIVSFSGTLGAISIFTVVYIYNLIPKKLTRFLIIFVFVLFLFFVPIVYLNIIEESKFNIVLNYIFIVNGFILIALIIYQIIKSFKNEKYEYLKTSFFPIAIYIIGVSAFIALFAPFNATRHVLLLIPFILLFGHNQFEKTQGMINNFVIVASIILSGALGISDWIYADFYRKNIENITITNNKVWSLGHWGWQWYSKKAGMLVFSQENELNVRNGDIVVFPKDISKQKINKDIQLDTIRFITEPPTFFTFFSGKNFASMYNSYFNKPAWSLSKVSIDTIFICKIKKEIGIEEIVNRIRLDKSWLNIIRNKAINRNITLDSMLILDANWIINEKRKY